MCLDRGIVKDIITVASCRDLNPTVKINTPFSSSKPKVIYQMGKMILPYLPIKKSCGTM